MAASVNETTRIAFRDDVPDYGGMDSPRVTVRIDDVDYGPGYICVREPNSSCKRVMANVAGLAFLIFGTTAIAVNSHYWNNRAMTYVSGISFGLGLQALLKLNMPASWEAFYDEVLLFTAPIVFQAMAQGEINTPDDNLWKDLWFTGLAVHLGMTSFSHVTNIVSADAVRLSGQPNFGVASYPLFGRTNSFCSVLKYQTLFLVTFTALLSLGIWKQNTLMINIAALLGGREAGVLATQRFLDFVEKLRMQFNESISRGDQAIPPSCGTEVLTTAAKLIPFALPFILGGSGATNKWFVFIGIGAVAGSARIINARFFERGLMPRTMNRYGHESFMKLILDAITPFPPYIYSSDQRELEPTRYQAVDITKGALTIVTLAGVNIWMGWWLTQFKDGFDRSQLITAGVTANLGYLAACGVEALCTPGSNRLKNSIYFQLDNMEHLLGLLYLAVFNQYQSEPDSPGNAIPMWILWSTLLMMPLVVGSKKGRLDIRITTVIYYMWSIFTAVKYIKGQLIG